MSESYQQKRRVLYVITCAQKLSTTVENSCSMWYTYVYALDKVRCGRDGTRTRISRLSRQGAMPVTLHAHVYPNA